MGVAHVIYIPAVFVLGLVLGYVWGQRTALAAWERKRTRMRE